MSIAKTVRIGTLEGQLFQDDAGNNALQWYQHGMSDNQQASCREIGGTCKHVSATEKLGPYPLNGINPVLQRRSRADADASAELQGERVSIELLQSQGR